MHRFSALVPFRRCLPALTLLSALSRPVVAQQLAGPVPPPAAQSVAVPDAAEACAQSRLRAAAASPALLAVASVAHRRKMAQYDVKYYKLDLALENTSLAVSGSVWMRVEVGAAPLSEFAFELYQAPVGAASGAASLVIDRIEFGDQLSPQLSPQVIRSGGEATATLPAAAPAGTLLDVRIYYRGTAPSGNSAAIGNGLSTRGSVRLGQATLPYNVTWSLSEPFSAYEWFPCKQVLTDKADSSDVWVTTTLPNKVGSNGLLQATVPLPGNRVRYEWKSRYPIAYYLISVAVAPYVEHLSYARPAGGPVVPIVDYVYNQQTLNYYQAEINRTAGFIENFSNLCGLYPFAKEKYGHSMAPLGGGMEHQTMTTQDSYYFTLTAHELFHQWFGDNVTCASWTDIWLNESFASYGEYLSHQAFSTPDAARTWLNDAHSRALSQTGSVRVPDADTTNVGRIFSSGLSYKKGATVVHMLRYLLHDDEKFFRALRTYQSTLSGRTARTADLQRIFEAEAGRPLDYFFQQWYAGQGFPTFSVRWNQVGGQLLLSTTETVSRPAVTPFFDTEVDYKITFSDGSTRLERLRQSQPLTQATRAVAGTVVSIEVDPDQWLLNGAGTISRDATLLGAGAGRQLAPLTLAPNPAGAALTIHHLPAPRATAEVLDALGRVVLRQAVSAADARLTTASLAPGLYLVRLTDASGQRLGQGRFVKE